MGIRRRLKSWLSWFPWYRRRARDADLARELRDHLELEAEEQGAAGLSPEEAAHAAQRALGNTLKIEEDVRATWGFQWAETLLQDMRYGLRMLRKSPNFAIVALLTLTLGIGAATAIFSVVNQVLLRPLPFKNPSTLVLLHEGFPQAGFTHMDFSPPDLSIFEREQKSFSVIGAFQDERVNISGQAEPKRVVAARVSSSLFLMLGAEPMLGRTFTAKEDSPGHDVAVLSYGLWQHRYGGAPNVLGGKIELNRHPYTVIGIMPPGFVFPLAGLRENSSPAVLWMPMAFTPGELQNWGGLYDTSVLGRPRPGVTLEQARGEVQALSAGILHSYPLPIRDALHGAKLKISAYPFREEVVGSVRTLLLVLMVAVGFVLLIACANVATLLLSRGAARQKEVAVRTALGATRLRLARQMLTESLVLALGGAALGLLLAFWAKDLMLSLVPSTIALPQNVPLSGGVFVFAVGVSFFATVLFGLGPAIQVSSASLRGQLRGGGRGAGSGREQHRLQEIFVVAEFALAFALLAGAGLLVRSFAKLLETSPGFRPEHVLTLNVPLPRESYAKGTQVRDFYRQLLVKASNLPEVRNVALSSDLPIHGCGEMVAIAIEGKPSAEGKMPKAICQSWVMGNYFQTMGIPLLRGRQFTPEDGMGSLHVAIVNRAMERKYWPGQSAIGKRIAWGTKAWDTIVGIVGDVHEARLSAPATPHVYRPYNQLPAAFLVEDPFGDWHAMNVVVRTREDPRALTSSVVAQVHLLDPDLAVANVRTMTQTIRSSVAGPEFNTLLLGIFAGVALFLAAIGIYGVLAYSVAQQTHDIGIRMALGAQRRDVLCLVLKQGDRLALAGIGIGAVAALFLSRFLASLLYGVGPTDLLTFACVAVVLVVVALVASWVPAWRAMRVDPMAALRQE